MNTARLNLTLHPRQSVRWSDVRGRLKMWWQYSCSRSELEGLSDNCLQDMGISRCTAHFEAAKPFWVA